jgi:hypothetical protein
MNMAKKIQVPSAKSEDQPATRKMLSLVRDEVLQKMESGFNELRSANSRMQILLEEQNSNNGIVLEGLQALWQRQDRIERRLR